MTTRPERPGRPRAPGAPDDAEGPEGPELIDDGIPVGVPAGAGAGFGAAGGTRTVGAGPGRERGPDGFAHEADEILPDTAALVAQRDEYLGALQLLQADFANYKKRVLRQQEEQSGRAARDLVGTLLPVLDALDLADAHLSSVTAGGAGGGNDEELALRQARAMLLDILAKEGLERVDAAGVPFDPTIHDAVAHAPAPSAGPDDDTGTDAPGAAPQTVVDDVMRSGYRWRGQVLRPAMVRVRG
jgi:molecular chaperone GrpE